MKNKDKQKASRKKYKTLDSERSQAPSKRATGQSPALGESVERPKAPSKHPQGGHLATLRSRALGESEEAARLAGLDSIIGNREKYRDPTADAAIAAVYREQMSRRAGDPAGKRP